MALPHRFSYYKDWWLLSERFLLETSGNLNAAITSLRNVMNWERNAAFSLTNVPTVTVARF